MTTKYSVCFSRATLPLATLLFCLLPNNLGATDTPEPVKYIGPGSCAATSCHGSVKPVADSRILQNEYSTWILQDKHSRAYQALTGEVGERMARILKLGTKAEESQKCLVCHALYTTPEQNAAAPLKFPTEFPAKTVMARLLRGLARIPHEIGLTRNPSRRA